MTYIWNNLSTGDRLRRVADAIEVSYGTGTPHRQASWMYGCGTPMCVTGHAVALDPTFTVKKDLSGASHIAVDRAGVEVDWATAGCHALGIKHQPDVDAVEQGDIPAGLIEPDEPLPRTPLFAGDADVTPDVLRGLADEADAGASWAYWPSVGAIAKVTVEVVDEDIDRFRQYVISELERANKATNQRKQTDGNV